jgi:hypothetical protein
MKQNLNWWYKKKKWRAFIILLRYIKKDNRRHEANE